MHRLRNHKRGNILIVDDNLQNLALLANLLTEHGYSVRKAVSGRIALMGARNEQPDLLLLDIMMPDMDGYEVCRQLKADPQTAGIVVLFLSALTEPLDKVKAFEVGGVDYITKPFQIEEVLARVQHQVKLKAAQEEISRLNQELELRVQQRTAELEATNQQLGQEILEHRETQAKLTQMAFHDGLTGLPNRGFFMERLVEAMHRLHQSQPEPRQSEPRQSEHGQSEHGQSESRQTNGFAVLFLDCDRFKLVNDSFGHATGDQLLIAVTARLKNSLRPRDTIARMGGDEFAILLNPLDQIEDAILVAQRLHQVLKTPFRLGPNQLFINASIGIVIGNQSYSDPDIILRDADIAVYRAKALGRACYQIFDAGMHKSVQDLLQLETDLQIALEQQQFSLHYQPIFAVGTGEIAGLEALLRWHHPQHGFISPATFIPAAEETGLITAIGNWVLSEASRQFYIWLMQDLIPSTVMLSVNLSPKQFAQPALIERIDQILQATKLPQHCLNLEITETAIMENADSVQIVLKQLRERQIQLSIDDFGTGYSCLSYLHRFPVNNLKIDRSFVNQIGVAGENLEMISAIVSLAHHLHLTVTAEGIETPQQLNYLKTLGCELAQGFLLHKPASPEGIETLLKRKI